MRDNLELGAHILAGDRVRIDAAVERSVALFAMLAERMRQLAGTMSGGAQQMVAIARALMTAPTTIILDEPLLGRSAAAPRPLQRGKPGRPALVWSATNTWRPTGKDREPAEYRSEPSPAGRAVTTRMKGRL